MRLISKAYILHINKSKDHIDILLRECTAHHSPKHMVYQEWSIAQQVDKWQISSGIYIHRKGSLLIKEENMSHQEKYVI